MVKLMAKYFNVHKDLSHFYFSCFFPMIPFEMIALHAMQTKLYLVICLPTKLAKSDEVFTIVWRVSSFYDNHRVQVRDCFERPNAVLFFYFIFIFSRPGQGFPNFQKLISPGFQSIGSQTCDTNRFSKPVFTYQLLEILLSQKLIFNVQKSQNCTKK